MRRVGTLQNGRELGIADASLHPRRTDGARANADLDNVGTAQDQLLDHFTSDDIAGDDGMRRETCPDLFRTC